MEVDWDVGVMDGDLVGEEQQGAAGVDLVVGECLAVVDRAAPDAHVAAAARQIEMEHVDPCAATPQS